MSPEQFQYIWRKTIPHIEVGMGSGVFHVSPWCQVCLDWRWRNKKENGKVEKKHKHQVLCLVNISISAGRLKFSQSSVGSRRIQSSHRFPYGYLVTTSPQSKTPPWYAPIRPPKAFVALVVHRSHGWSLVRCFGRNQFPGCDGRCVQGPGTYSPRHADPRLLAIPTSCSRVAENNPNWGNLSGFAQPYCLASHCNCHCSTCVAQPMRAMLTWRHPHLPPVFHWQSLVSAARTFGFVSERGEYYYHVVTTPPGGLPECRVFSSCYLDVVAGWQVEVLPFERNRIPIVKWLRKAQWRADIQSSGSAVTRLLGLLRWPFVLRRMSQQQKMRVSLVIGLDQTSHDTSWRQPCSTCMKVSTIPLRTGFFVHMSRAGKVLRVVSN